MQVRFLLAAIFLGISSCSLSLADDDSRVFDDLTAHVWLRGEPGQFGFAESIRLRRGGEYHWQRRSDIIERDDQGRWALVVGKKDHSLLRLSKSAEAPLRIEKDKLFLGSIAFERGEKIVYDEAERKLGLADLKPVEASENFQKLTRTAWVKTNPFDDYREPQKIEFDASGGFLASYRGDECRTKGIWQLIVEGEFTRFIARTEENSCDLRGGSAMLPSDRLRFVDDLMLLGAPYAPLDKKPKRNVFIFDRYGNSVRTRGEFDGSFTKGRAVRIDLTHEGGPIKEYKLVSLDIGFQKCEIGKSGIKPIGKMEAVLHKDLAETIVTWAKPHRQTVEFTPPLAGRVIFQIQLKYQNFSQPFEAPQKYVMQVQEK
ncbi:MAG: hypothetical protein ACKVP0_14400 [Pirellulaceae bacterium]